MKKIRFNFCLLLFFVFFTTGYAQNDVMMQGFYWDVPVDQEINNGSWWDTLAVKAPELSDAGITGIWTPAPSKGNFGIIDMGYGVFDHYDLGNYDQKGTIETRFGSRTELLDMVQAMHDNGLEVYADIILNHIFTGDTEEEDNPAVKYYVDNEAYINGTQYTPYPTNEVKWVIPDAAAGDYYIKIDGYMLDYDASYKERAYDLYINWDGSVEDDSTVYWESEPNDGNGEYNIFPGSGKHLWAHINEEGDIDEYKISLSASHDIVLRLVASRENSDGELEPTDQTNGYRVYEVWHGGENLATSTLEAHTNTGVEYVNHTGTGEANYSWNYSHFHPVDENDFLTGGGFEDQVAPNWKLFGNDINTFNSTVQNRFIDWGVWLTNTVDFDGYRLDFVRGYQEEWAARWINNMPRRGDGSQRFAVGEYFSGYKYRIKDWVEKVASFEHNGNNADVDAFDFPLKFTLTDMANWNGTDFDMNWLNHAGMVRDNNGNSLSGKQVVTFVENHDTGKEHDKWIERDWDMAHAYILFAEGRPTIFYPHFYSVTLMDQDDSTKTVTSPPSLQDDIKELIFIRKTYLGGTMAVLSENGNPYPAEDTYDIHVARRQGNGSKTGAILVLNNHETETKDLWIDHRTSTEYADWSGKLLVNITSGDFEETQVYDDGRVNVWAPARGYAVWVPKDEYTPYSGSSKNPGEPLPNLEKSNLPEQFKVDQNYPNPFNPSTNITFSIPRKGHVTATVYDILGQRIATLADRPFQKGSHNLRWDATNVSSGTYFYIIKFEERQITKSMLLIK